jgi:hypothetical protein
MGRNNNAAPKLSFVIHQVLLHITGIQKGHRE